jgi:hypothetical protein
VSTQNAIEEVAKARAEVGLIGDAAKAITVSTGIVNYDLRPGMIQTYPYTAEMTMLGAELPRVPANGDTASRWKAITGINTANTHLGISEGQRGGSVTTSTANLSVNYVKLGLEDSVTFEADYAAEGFDDAKSIAMANLLRAALIGQEKQLLWGNASNALGTTPTPTVANAGSGGGIAAATYNVSVVALTPEGLDRAGGVVAASTTGAAITNAVPQRITKTNVDATTDTINGGAAQKSATAATTTSGSTSVITATVAVVDGAAGYAWFVGTAGNEVLAAITSINSVSLSALPNSGNQALSALAAADYSADSSYNMDGLFTYARTSLNATVYALPTGVAGTGTKLTASGRGTISEIDTALVTFYKAWKFNPDEMLLSMDDYNSMVTKIINNGGAPIARIVQEAVGGNPVAAGILSYIYVSPNGQRIRMRVHPFAPQGTILLYSKSLPYAGTGIGAVMQVKTRKEWYATEWPLRTRKWEYGTYADQCLQHFAPFSMVKITNIALG